MMGIGSDSTGIALQNHINFQVSDGVKKDTSVSTCIVSVVL
jgi:hypothetical protein